MRWHDGSRRGARASRESSMIAGTGDLDRDCRERDGHGGNLVGFATGACGLERMDMIGHPMRKHG